MIERRIAIIDYNLGNLYSVQNALTYLGLRSTITSDPKELLSSYSAILPGVGAFGEAMNHLEKMDLIHPIKDFISSGRPFFGICLGLQLLFSVSYEFGVHKGLGLIEGEVIKFLNPSKETKVPQIGWNKINIPQNKTWKNTPLENIADGTFMYFVHSFYVKPTKEDLIITTTNYDGLEYCSGIYMNNIFATQFHPEKSGEIGLNIYRDYFNKIIVK
jgi:glutamine amidotransferase